MCIYVACEYVWCERVKVGKCVSNVIVFGVVIRVCRLSWWDVDVRDV